MDSAVENGNCYYKVRATDVALITTLGFATGVAIIVTIWIATGVAFVTTIGSATAVAWCIQFV